MAGENDAATSDNADQSAAAEENNGQQADSQAENLYPENDNGGEDQGSEDGNTGDDEEQNGDESEGNDDESENEDENAEGDGEVELKFDDLPDGMQLDEELLTTFQSYVKDKGTSQEDAQELADLYKEAAISQFNTQIEAHHQMVDQWFESSKADEEIAGKDGSLFEQNADLAKKAFDTFGTPELGELLSRQQTGIGDNPEFVRFAMRIGKAISEDSLQLPNNGGGGGEESQEDILYPNMK